MLYLNSTLNFWIPPVLVSQLEVYYKVDRLLTGLTAQQKGTTARWYSNKTSLTTFHHTYRSDYFKKNCSDHLFEIGRIYKITLIEKKSLIYPEHEHLDFIPLDSLDADDLFFMTSKIWRKLFTKFMKELF